MNYIKILDSFSVAFAWFIVCIMLCKFFEHKKHTRLFAIILLPAFFSLHFVTHRYDNIESMTYSRIVIQQALVLIMFLLFALYVFYCLKLSIGEKFAIFGMHIATTLVSEIFLSYLMISLTSDSQSLWNAPDNIRILVDVLYLIINLFLSFSILSLFKKYRIKLPWKVILMILIIAINVIGLFMLAVNPSPAASNSNAYIYNTTVALVCATTLVVLIIMIVKFMIAQEHRNEEFTWIKNIQNMEIERYSDDQNKMKEQRKIQHDYKGNLTVLKLLIDSGEESKIKRASDMMSSLLDKAQSVKITTYTNNEIVNAVLSSKIKEANESGIKVETDINLPKEIGNIEDSDLSSLFMNLLSNAIEACQNDLVKDKFIKVSTILRANFLIIKVVNSYSSIKRDSKGKIVTTKKDKENHGIGLRIIKSICDKYKGDDDINPKEHEFIHTVSLVINTPVKSK